MNIGSDLSFFSLVFGASIPVQFVMLIFNFSFNRILEIHISES